MKRLLEQYDNYVLSISMTTRSPRVGERDSVDYFFSTREDFEKYIAGDGFIEYAKYCDNYYGTPKAYVQNQLDNGKDVILEIEIQGALEVKKKYPEAILLFVTPPSATELKRRLTGRGTETQGVINKRMNRAVEEADGIEDYDFIVVNDDLDTCVAEIHGIVQAAHDVPFRNIEFIEKMKEELSRVAKGEK